MFSAIFQDRMVFVISACLAVLLAAAISFVLARRFDVRAWSWAGLSAAITAEVALTLFLPSGDGAAGTGRCVINHNFAEPFATEQGLLNAALFMPIGVFGVLATRRLLPVLAGGIGLSLATELLQTMLPGVSRGCDSSDLQMNALGAISAAMLTWWFLRIRGRETPPAATAAKPTALVSTVVLAAAAVTWTAFITPINVDATSLQLTGAKERAAAEGALKLAFGDHVEISAVQLQTGFEGRTDSLLITLDRGGAELSWPDTSRFTASLENSSVTTEDSFPVEGVSRPPEDEQEALQIARRYAEPRYPWGLRNSEVQSVAVGDRGELGWIVSWRRLNEDKILMPMRLDVQINTAGRVSQLLVHHIEDPKTLPKPAITRKAASAIALRTIDRPDAAEHVRVQECALRAVDRNGTWGVNWICAFESADSNPTPAPVVMDAVTGKPQEQQQAEELEPPSGTVSDVPPGENGPRAAPEAP